MQCCAESIKCCTDKLVCAVNCIGVPTSTVLIACKGYEVPYTENIDWGYTILPAASLVAFNFTYYLCWRGIKKTVNKPLFEKNSGSELV